MSDWTIETDEEADARRRTGAIDGRFQVCHPAEGLIEAVNTLAEAFEIADRYAMRTLPDGKPYCTTPEQVEVYDRMARRGQPRTWRRIAKGTVNLKICVEHGDYCTIFAWWKCIEKRGLKRKTDDFTSLLWS